MAADSASVTVTATDQNGLTVTGSTTANASGQWQHNGLNVSSLSDGTLTFTAVQTLPDGTQTSSTLPLTVSKDTVAATVWAAITGSGAVPSRATDRPSGDGQD